MVIIDNINASHQKEAPLVSIIIPVYNGSDFLKQAIDSALEQSYKNIEIIVVNDGSNDNGKTHEIALSYGDKIKYHSKENGGVSTALNFGISMMKGVFFSWLSHDDVYFPTKIEKQVNFISTINKRNCIVYSDIEIIDKNSKHIAYKKYKSIEKGKFAYFLLKDLFLNGCTLLIPARCFESFMFDEKRRTTQDNDLWLRLSEKYDFVYFPEVVLKSRYHENQGIRSIPTHQDEVLQFYQFYLKKYTIDEWLKLSERKYMWWFYFTLAFSTFKHGLINTSAYLFNLSIDHSGFPVFVKRIFLFKAKLLFKLRRMLSH